VSVVGPALPGVAAAFDLGLEEVGLLAAVLGAGQTVSVLAGGFASDRWGRRPTLLAGAALLLAGVAALGVAPTWAAALAGMATVGAGAGLLDGSLNTLLGEHGGDERSADLNLAHAFFGLGAIVGPLLAAPLLAAGFGWRALYAPAAGIALAVAALAWRLDPGTERAAAVTDRPGWDVVREPVVLLLALVLALYAGVELAVGTWAFSYLRMTFGAGDSAAALATALFWGGITLGRLAVGAFGGRLGPHALIAVNTIAAALALALTLVAPSLGAAAVGFGLLGVSLANIFPAVMALGAEACPYAAGTVTGILIGASGTGAAVFPWLAGLIGERAGLGAALGCTVVLLMAMLAAARLARRLDRGAAPKSVLASS